MKSFAWMTLLAALLFTTVCRADMYKWTDNEGVIHYVNEPTSQTVPVALPPLNESNIEKYFPPVEKDDIKPKRKQAKARGPVNIGMAAEEVLKKGWGKPLDVRRTTTVSGAVEQWVYPGDHNYLYFTNGVLTAVQN